MRKNNQKNKYGQRNPIFIGFCGVSAGVCFAFSGWEFFFFGKNKRAPSSGGKLVVDDFDIESPEEIETFFGGGFFEGGV